MRQAGAVAYMDDTEKALTRLARALSAALDAGATVSAVYGVLADEFGMAGYGYAAEAARQTSFATDGVDR